MDSGATGTWFRFPFPLKLQDWPLSLLPHQREEPGSAAGTCETERAGPGLGPHRCSAGSHFLLQHAQPQPGSRADKDVACSLALQAVL